MDSSYNYRYVFLHVDAGKFGSSHLQLPNLYPPVLILSVCACVYKMYDNTILTAKFKSANIFISAARDQTTKFKDRQYCWLYTSMRCFLHLQL